MPSPENRTNPSPESFDLGIESTSTDRIFESGRESVAERLAGESVNQQGVAWSMPKSTPSLSRSSDDNDDSSNPTTISDTPSVASDDEVIEKEWVDKAKRVIASTRDDPYRREKEVAELQADYLSKRYGRILGSRK